MLAFILRRLLSTAIVIILVSFIAFSLVHFIPGDPALAMLGADATKEQVDALRKELWLDRPLPVQYGHWFNNVLHVNFGKSLIYNENVTSVILRSLPIMDKQERPENRLFSTPWK